MIRITLDLPATAADVVTYAELVTDISPDVQIATEDGCLVGVVGQAPAVAEPEPEAAPKAAKAAAPKAKPKAKAKAAPVARGGVRQAVLDVIEAHDGHFEGSAADLAREAHPANPASGAATVKVMMVDGTLVAERKGQRIHAIRLAGRRLNPVPEAVQGIEESPLAVAPRPAPVAPSGLTPPAGGWG